MPFSTEEFFAVFAAYNQAIWPLQIFAVSLGALLLLLALFRRGRPAAFCVAWGLAVMWAVDGVGFHWLFFAGVTPAAWGFGALFLAQAAALVVAPVVWPDLRFTPRADPRTVAGLALTGFALAVYPAWGVLSGQSWPAMPIFGVAPCPTTIFTIGLLLLAPWRRARWLLAIPAAWALIGGAAAVLLDVPQDAGLPASLLVILVFWRGHRAHRAFALHGQEA